MDNEGSGAFPKSRARGETGPKLRGKKGIFRKETPGPPAGWKLGISPPLLAVSPPAALEGWGIYLRSRQQLRPQRGKRGQRKGGKKKRIRVGRSSPGWGDWRRFGVSAIFQSFIGNISRERGGGPGRGGGAMLRCLRCPSKRGARSHFHLNPPESHKFAPRTQTLPAAL